MRLAWQPTFDAASSSRRRIPGYLRARSAEENDALLKASAEIGAQ